MTEEKADEEMEEDPPVPLVTHANNNLYSIFSKVELYINDQQIYNWNELYIVVQFQQLQRSPC